MSTLVFAASLTDSLPPFDWTAAVVVGAIVVVAAAIILTGGIATPFIAVQMGASYGGTALAVAGISLLTGLIAGGAAGFYLSLIHI